MVNLIFDLDGCLIDSSLVQREAFFGSYKEIVGDNKCPPYEEYLKYTGDSISNVMIKMGLPVQMVNPYRRISNESISKIKVNYECINLIKKYKKAGSKIAICTGKDHDRAEKILDFFRINSCFDCLVSSDDVSNPKPKPDSIFRAIEIMKVEKETCIFIGDGYNDLLAAKNAGIKSVLTIWYGDEGVERLCDWVVKDVRELDVILSSLS